MIDCYKNKFIEKECKLTNGEIKSLFSFFSQAITNSGMSKLFSVLILENLQILEYAVRAIDKAAPSLDKIPGYEEYQKKCVALLERCCDRDTQGHPIKTADGGYQITEQIIEYEEEKEKLNNENNELIDKISHNESNYNFYMEEEEKIVLNLFDDFNDYPESLPPIIVGILQKLY